MAGDNPRKTTTTERILDTVFRQAGQLARRTLDRKLEGADYSKKDVKQIVAREGALKRFAAAALTRLATRSVPGAITVSGAIAAGALLRRRNSAASEVETTAAVEDGTE